METMLKPSDVAAHFKVSVDTVRRWIRDGRLPCKNIGTSRRPTYRIAASSLAADVMADPKDRAKPIDPPRRTFF